MTETKEDMKITKFKVITEHIHKYLMNDESGGLRGYFKKSQAYRLLSYYPVFIDKYVENEYVRVIRQQFMCTPEELEEVNVSHNYVSHNALEYIHNALEYIHNADKFQERTLLSNDGTMLEGYECKDENVLIFWLLFLTAINEDLYNNELSSIIDFAYCLKFDEPMIRDWCNAVKYVLEGNHLNENCDLQCVTNAGKEFFLHQKTEMLLSEFSRAMAFQPI